MIVSNPGQRARFPGRLIGSAAIGLVCLGAQACSGPALVAFQAVSFALTGKQVYDLANQMSEADMPYVRLGGRWRAKDQVKTILVVDNVRNRLQVGEGRKLLLQGSLAVVQETRKIVRLRVFTGRHRPAPELTVRFIKKDLISASFKVEGKKTFTEELFHRIKPGKKPPMALVPQPGSVTDGTEVDALLAAEANTPLDRPVADEEMIAAKFPDLEATPAPPAAPAPPGTKVPPPPPGSIAPRPSAPPASPAPSSAATPPRVVPTHTVPAPSPSPTPAPVKPPAVTPRSKPPESFFGPGGA